MGAKVTIDVVHDVVCPWCFVGKRRLERALAARPDLDVELRYLPFFLDPTVPLEGIPRFEYISRKFGTDKKVTPMHQRLVGIGADLGIDFQFEKIERQPNTLDAHRAIAWAQENGRAAPVVERLFELFFTEGADLSDHEVIASAAATGGLDPAMVRGGLGSERDADLIRNQAIAASSAGIGGVPFFVIAKRLGVSGAQEPEVLVSAIDQALSSAEPAAGGV